MLDTISSSSCSPFSSEDLSNSKNLSCENKLWVLTPSKGKAKPEVYTCDKIMNLSTFDYMIFKIKETPSFKNPIAKPIKMHTENTTTAGETVYAWTVDTVSNPQGLSAKLIKKTCKVTNSNNTNLHKIQNNLNATTEVSNCSKPLLESNTGASFFNKSNEAVFVLGDDKNKNVDSKKLSTNIGIKHYCTLKDFMDQTGSTRAFGQNLGKLTKCSSKESRQL